MNTVKIARKNAKMIAHRGLSGIEAENSNAAFVAAGNRSYFGIETDVHVTRDGRFIIHHDDNIKRMTGVDAVIEETDAVELSLLRLYDRNRENRETTETRSDLSLPTLDEYINICKKYGKVAVLELKRRMATESIAGIVEEIRRLDYLDNTIFISFSLMNMQDVRRILPDQKLQYLVSAWDNDLLETLKKDSLDLDIAGSQVTPELVKLLHENGIEINCWTVDSPETATKLVEMGVDYITSNILE